MEVLDARCTVISNAEALNLLITAKAKQNKERSLRQHQTVLYETVKYLKETPAISQTEQHVVELMKALEPYKLTGAEVLQIVNHRPTDSLGLGVLIEECDERINDDQMGEILDIVIRILPAPVNEASEAS
ncbi:unnamed protein product [Bursaphelenchus okinawaensis]|uniref:DNA-directed RNA polymerase III subunit RPC9 n=1 Tax=Bursaphelenchus okinawaensis TaxID=465554 RepID=A0A811KUI2_9BILA|nr:unnamed protein product [Bursaphelenchus okinawaensis]CAG9112524.1 unnamed protein product [Bursaphelenchus okinawaensis]